MEGIPKDLPYRAEYAKSGRAGCKGCGGEKIEKDDLKLAFMVQSRFHDGKDAVWFHPTCFFQKHRPKTVGDISHFEQLRWNDQEMIKKKIEAATVPSKGKAKDALKEFSVAYAKSGASTCGACEDKIPKGAVRISKLDYTSEKAIMWGKGGGVERWHHLDCFVKVRNELEFFESGKLLPGFKNLDREDQVILQNKLPQIKPVTSAASQSSSSSSTSTGKRKLEEKKDSSTSSVPSKKSKKENTFDDELRKQNETMFKYRDALKEFGKKDLQRILTSNKQIDVPPGDSECLDRIQDIMTFGALKPCKKCKGQLVFRSGVGYQCLGFITEFAKCLDITDDPERVPFKVPNDFRELPPFNKYKAGKTQKRLTQHIAPSATPESRPKLVRKPLKNFNFYIACSDKEKMLKWKAKIEGAGGKISSSKSGKVAAIVSTQTEVQKNPKEIDWAKKKGVPVVKGDFAENITEVNYNLTKEITKYLICDWVEDIGSWLKTKNVEYEETSIEKKKEKRDAYEKKLTSVTLKVKDGAVVDPDSELDDVGHVLRDGKKFFNCVLNRTSFEDQKNSFYKQQIIESDVGHKYFLFQAWGRIGTVIGGQLVKDHLSKDEAIELFQMKFEDLTGNVWGRTFKQNPGKYTMLEIDYGEKEQLAQLVPSSEKSLLAMSVQELVSLIFDVTRMKQAMMEFELNLEEMPLGKISRKQVLKAYSTLSEASALIEKSDEGSAGLIRDATNRFYTLIPHNFGRNMPPLLDNNALVKTKLEMLESLLEIELAYEMLLEGEKGGESSIDSHYKTLNAAIDPLEAGSEEFSMLQKYLKNTHADTHSSYSLEVDHIFKVNRMGENKRSRAFKDLHNRKLLWHGSRITNYAGILSQGLRIAPAEAPVTGYMFGKGIYFADMVSKSANYCHANRQNTTGLLLVCEVALGDMKEMKNADDTLTKAPEKFHSVKGLGQTEPNPLEIMKLSNGVEVPLGKPTPTKAKNSDLLYNEYIVYDVAQVNIRYLMKVNFVYSDKRRR